MSHSKHEVPIQEIYHGITQATISDIQEYLDNTFGIVKEEQLNGGKTEFNVDDIPIEQIEEVVSTLQEIVGKNFTIDYVEVSTEKNMQRTIVVSNKKT